MIVAIERWRVRAIVPVAVVIVLAVGSHAASAQAPVVNAKIETRSAAQGLAREVQAITDRGTATWLGYRVPIARRGNARFDSSGTCCGRCRLEPPTELVVLARFEARALTELRAMSIDCDVDGGGMPLVWLESVDPDQSVSWLGSLVTDDGRRGAPIEEAALMGIALHAAPSAGGVLVRFARDGRSSQTRGRALFWLAQRAADQAASVITEAIDRDPDVEVKRKAVFALSQLPAGEGVPHLIDVARSNRSLAVRRQAMFWLGQSKDPRAIDFFEKILAR